MKLLSLQQAVPRDACGGLIQAEPDRLGPPILFIVLLPSSQPPWGKVGDCPVVSAMFLFYKRSATPPPATYASCLLLVTQFVGRGQGKEKLVDATMYYL